MQTGPRIGVADSGHFDGFRVPLSSASFCTHLIISYFQKLAETRSPAAKNNRPAHLSTPFFRSTPPGPIFPASAVYSAAPHILLRLGNAKLNKFFVWLLQYIRLRRIYCCASEMQKNQTRLIFLHFSRLLRIFARLFSRR